MKLELHLTRSTGVFNIDRQKSTYQSKKIIEQASVESKEDFDALMAEIFSDWTPIDGSEYKRIIVGCSNVYKNKNIFVCVQRANHDAVRKEAMSRHYIKQGKAILMGSPERFPIGKSPVGYPQIIVTGIIDRHDYEDCDETYLNTEVNVVMNPEYQWETDDSVCDSIFNQ